VSWLTPLGTIAAALLGFIVYFRQKEVDRTHQILSERRSIYLDYADALSGHMYNNININSEHHFKRRDALNRVGAKLAIVGTPSILGKHYELVAHLAEKEKTEDDGSVENYFDDKAQALLNEVFSEMRKDALPSRIRVNRK
jgi:hypothetical protein